MSVRYLLILSFDSSDDTMCSALHNYLSTMTWRFSSSSSSGGSRRYRSRRRCSRCCCGRFALLQSPLLHSSLLRPCALLLLHTPRYDATSSHHDLVSPPLQSSLLWPFTVAYPAHVPMLGNILPCILLGGLLFSYLQEAVARRHFSILLCGFLLCFFATS